MAPESFPPHPSDVPDLVDGLLVLLDGIVEVSGDMCTVDGACLPAPGAEEEPAE